MDAVPENAGFPAPPPSFGAALREMQIELERGDLERMGEFLRLLAEANSRFNLTAIKEPAAMWERHVQDSLTLFPVLASASAAGQRLAVCDVGSGGGLPAIPLALVFPDADFTLLESTGKKANFLSDTVAQLRLANVRVICDRAETSGQDHRAMRERFDVVTARAVAPMNVLLELCLPLARSGGIFATIKGEKAQEELAACGKALGELRGRVVSTDRTSTGTVVVVEKTGKTPRLYPRFAGEPGRRPL